jgi:hypothetical protein
MLVTIRDARESAESAVGVIIYTPVTNEVEPAGATNSTNRI